MLLDKKKYKDQCEKCSAFAVLKSFNGKCLCENCIKFASKNNSIKNRQCFNTKLAQEKQISIYDMLWRKQ